MRTNAGRGAPLLGGAWLTSPFGVVQRRQLGRPRGEIHACGARVDARAPRASVCQVRISARTSSRTPKVGGGAPVLGRGPRRRRRGRRRRRRRGGRRRGRRRERGRVGRRLGAGRRRGPWRQLRWLVDLARLDVRRLDRVVHPPCLRVVERWSCGAVERWSGGAVERWSCGAVELWSGGAEKRPRTAPRPRCALIK